MLGPLFLCYMGELHFFSKSIMDGTKYKKYLEGLNFGHTALLLDLIPAMLGQISANKDKVFVYYTPLKSVFFYKLCTTY